MLCLANTFIQNNVLKVMQFQNYLYSIRSLNPWLCNHRSASCRGSSSSKGKHQIKYKPYVPPCHLDHDHKNMSMRRPMSPHLTIYAPTIPAATSIFQRISGVLLTIYAILLAGGTLFLSNGIETYVSIIQSMNLSRPSAFFIKIIMGAPFAFHYFNGIRFCAWNAGRLLSKKDIMDTAFKSWIAAAVITLFFAFL